MPAPANLRRRDYFVYQFKADGYPFYVGIGHSERASDRLRYVRSLMVPKNVDKLAEKALSVRVIAALLKRKVEIRFSCTRRPMNRRQALDLELRTIARLVAAGYLLTNWQHNPYRHDDPARAVRAILKRRCTAGASSL